MSKKNQGILCILSAAFFFALMNLFVRLSGDLPTVQKSFFRNFIAAILAFIMLTRSPQKVTLTKENQRPPDAFHCRNGWHLMQLLCR